MDRTSYTNLAKSWEYVEDHAFSRQSTDLNAIRTHAEEAGIPQGFSSPSRSCCACSLHMVNATSVIAVGTGSVVETLQLVNGLDNSGQLTAVDSSSQGIALIRTLFNRLSDETQTTLSRRQRSRRRVFATSECRKLRFDCSCRRRGKLRRFLRAGSPPVEEAWRNRVHRYSCF